MTIQVGCPRYWRAREKRMRDLASKATDPMTYLALMHSAETYMGLAERAERREKIEQELLVVGKTTGRAIEVRDCGA